eukprot:2335565-Amphidinium_carterae.1
MTDCGFGKCVSSDIGHLHETCILHGRSHAQNQMSKGARYQANMFANFIHILKGWGCTASIDRGGLVHGKTVVWVPKVREQ